LHAHKRIHTTPQAAGNKAWAEQLQQQNGLYEWGLLAVFAAISSIQDQFLKQSAEALARLLGQHGVLAKD
jgi:hypothetical protein